MRHLLAVLSLTLPLALASCKKKEAPRDTAPDKTVAAQKQADECAELLKTCMYESCPPEQPETSDAATDLTGTEAEMPEFEVKIGETYVLGQGNQTVVMNPKPVQDDLRRFAKGSVCRFDPMGKVKIVGKRVYKMDGDGEEETEYLVRYAREPAPEALHPGVLEYPDADPYECPDGTVFYLDDVTILEPEEPDAAFEAAKKLLSSEKP